MDATIYIILLVISLHCMRMKGLKRDKMILLFVQIIEEEGERLKFLKIYENYRYRMLFISKQILNDQGLAEDAVQESFLYLAVNIHTIDTDILSPRTRNFIYLVTRHKSIDLLRKAKGISVSVRKNWNIWQAAISMWKRSYLKETRMHMCSGVFWICLSSTENVLNLISFMSYRRKK